MTEKGWPPGVAPADAIAAGLRVADLPLPVLALHADALAHNIGEMAAWCEHEGFLLAPHGKTTMAPRLFERQLAAGAWAITVANAGQARVACAAGAPRVLIANQLTDPRDVRWAAAQDIPVSFLVDSLAGVEIAARALDDVPHGGDPVPVLVEVGYDGGRTGARSLDQALAVARAAAAVPRLRVAGVEAFEGLLGSIDAVDALLEHVTVIARAFAAAGLLGSEPLLSAGGSAYFDRVAEILGPVAAELGGRLVLRSGCYVTHDHGLYARQAPGEDRLPGGPRFRPAIEIRAAVLSRPEPSRAILGVGRRDLSYDSGLPIRLDGPGEIVALNDQHAHLSIDAGTPLAVGDVVRLGISHPCTTLERWRLIPVVDAGGTVIEAVATHF